jgi:hypothetical protein
MRFALVTLTAAIGLAGCYLGTKAERFDPARKPQGVSAEVQAHGRALKGELLEIGPSSLLLLAEGARANRVVLVAYSAIEDARFAQMKTCRIHGGAPPDERVREQLRQVSRFPQGLAPDLLQRILENHHQAEPERLSP